MSHPEKTWNILNFGLGTIGELNLDESSLQTRITMEPKQLANKFSALSCEPRVQIMKLLARSKEPLNVETISQLMNIKHASASAHLKVLDVAGLVNRQQMGRFVVYSVDNVSLLDLETELKLLSRDVRLEHA